MPQSCAGRDRDTLNDIEEPSEGPKNAYIIKALECCSSLRVSVGGSLRFLACGPVWGGFPSMILGLRNLDEEISGASRTVQDLVTQLGALVALGVSSLTVER